MRSQRIYTLYTIHTQNAVSYGFDSSLFWILLPVNYRCWFIAFTWNVHYSNFFHCKIPKRKKVTNFNGFFTFFLGKFKISPQKNGPDKSEWTIPNVEIQQKGIEHNTNRNTTQRKSKRHTNLYIIAKRKKNIILMGWIREKSPQWWQPLFNCCQPKSHWTVRLR